MKSRKPIIINTVLLFALIAVMHTVMYFLEKNRLALTSLSTNIYLVLVNVLVISLAVQVILLLVRLSKNSNKKSKRVIMSCLVGLISVLTVVFGLAFLLGYALTKPEHIVEKDGVKSVACVDSYLQVIVNYYDYKNPFVRGDVVKRFEDYGSGGYDPFTCQFETSVKRYTVYDDNGRVIDSFNN